MRSRTPLWIRRGKAKKLKTDDRNVVLVGSMERSGHNVGCKPIKQTNRSTSRKNQNGVKEEKRFKEKCYVKGLVFYPTFLPFVFFLPFLRFIWP